MQLLQRLGASEIPAGDVYVEDRPAMWRVLRMKLGREAP